MTKCTLLAQIVAEILLKAKPIFSWFGRATKGSSCQTLEKKALLKEIEEKSWRWLLKK